MAIKKMSIDMFDSIAKESKKECKTESVQETKYLTEKDFEYLCDKAMLELYEITLVINTMVDTVLKSQFGRLILDTDEFMQFKDSSAFYLTNMLPSLLTGDLDSIIEEYNDSDDKEEFQKTLEELRVTIYENLVKKYL